MGRPKKHAKWNNEYLYNSTQYLGDKAFGLWIKSWIIDIILDNGLMLDKVFHYNILEIKHLDYG